MINRKRKKGFTLVELLISISILSFIIAVSYSLFEGNIKFFNQKTNQVTSENDIRVLSDWLTKDLKNTIPDNVRKDERGDYIIGTIRYSLIETGKIENRKVFKLQRESNKEGKIDLVNSIAEGSTGFNVDMPTDTEPYYKIRLTIIDKFNKDKNINFKVSYLNGKVAVNDDPTDNPNDDPNHGGGKGTPFIDLNDNRVFDGDDYRIQYTKAVGKQEWEYNTKDDEKYQQYKAKRGRDFNLVFDLDFDVKGNPKGVSFLVEGNIIIKPKVTVSTNKYIKLKSAGTVDFNYGILESSGQGEILVDVPGSMTIQYGTLEAIGGGKILINVLGSMNAQYCKMNCNGNSKIEIKVGGALDCSYGNLNTSGKSAINIVVQGSISTAYVEKGLNVNIN